MKTEVGAKFNQISLCEKKMSYPLTAIYLKMTKALVEVEALRKRCRTKMPLADSVSGKVKNAFISSCFC